METKKKTILVVDDNAENLDILAELLEEYDVIDTTDGYEALEILNEEKVDLILLDVMMPEIDGFELCKKIKDNPQTQDIPIMFITALTDEDSIVKSYEIGGSDYITKPFKKKELLAKVKREFKIQDLQNELKLMASTDPLTKLYNRRYFKEVSKHFVFSAKRENEPLSVLMLDIDKFKSINDTYGHDVGDKVIKTIANILTKNRRKSDLLCRWGGEEFLILLPNTNVEGAFSVAEKIRKTVENTDINVSDEKQIKITVSIGISQMELKEEDNLEPAIRRADEALYTAKERGRNCIVLKDF
ncbi:diguanylate cyclase [Persephonella atlantica]|uniref:diguanylate cyclase n=1 Tax=Persephonella atlantica TaxID=2699429 RepID=A0ABS1GHM2_9AQUI|nr:diguanylate cyclase [Persephonella atlantica]MBK3332423.1 diguanylate cyclase [Persephonella atlantica]